MVPTLAAIPADLTATTAAALLGPAGAVTLLSALLPFAVLLVRLAVDGHDVSVGQRPPADRRAPIVRVAPEPALVRPAA
jgi:hypothetical protein